MKKKSIATILCRVGLFVLLPFVVVLPSMADSADKPAVYYFYENYCESCHPEDTFADEFRVLTGRSLADYSYACGNVAHAAGRALYERIVHELSVPEEKRLLPMMIIDGQIFAGSRSISGELPRLFLESGNGTESLVYYLYAPACESCAQAEQVLAELGSSITVKRGEYAFESALTVRKINIYEDTGTAQALFERYHVPDAQRVTPIVFARDRYFSGLSSITNALTLDLRTGGAIGTPLLAEDAVPPAYAGSWIETALAGLIAGFNPCALSMLLFLLALLIGANMPVRRLTIAFLGAKLLTYLSIGFLLVRLFNALHFSRLPFVAKIILTVLCGVLIFANIRDAWLARRERYGELKNQLPVRLRRFLHRRIDKAVSDPGPWLTASVCALGVIVASGEFLCAGQLYLASITAQLHAGIGGWRVLAMLLTFSAMFLLPSAVLSALVIQGRRVFDLSERLRAGMPLIKLATAFTMAVICLFIWLI